LMRLMHCRNKMQTSPKCTPLIFSDPNPDSRPSLSPHPPFKTAPCLFFFCPHTHTYTLTQSSPLSLPREKRRGPQRENMMMQTGISCDPGSKIQLRKGNERGLREGQKKRVTLPQQKWSNERNNKCFVTGKPTKARSGTRTTPES